MAIMNRRINAASTERLVLPPFASHHAAFTLPQPYHIEPYYIEEWGMYRTGRGAVA